MVRGGVFFVNLSVVSCAWRGVSLLQWVVVQFRGGSDLKFVCPYLMIGAGKKIGALLWVMLVSYL